MPELILILFKINLVLLLFAAAYYVVLRRLTFYTVNRAFLVLGIIFSTIYPFINLTEFFNRQEQINPNVVALVPNIDVNSLIRNPAIIDYWQIVVLLFYVGVAFMAVRLIAQFISLYRVHQRSTPGTFRNLNVRILDGEVSPFSFWQTVYVNPAIHSVNELDTILAHEQVHVKEWHTLDIILAEISVVLYWFNPGVWLMKRAIKENIEFITDARIVKRGVDKKAYQYSLLGVGNLQSTVALVNHFNLSDLKKRIKMMNSKRSSPRKLVIYALILPVLLVTTLAFTVNRKEVKAHLMPIAKALVKVNIFNEPSAKITTESPKTKEKRKSFSPKINQIKADTVTTIHYLFNTITLTNDSTRQLPDLPDAERMIAMGNTEAVKNIVKGIRLHTGAVFVNGTDSVHTKGTVGRVENISISLRRPGVALPNPEGADLKEIIVTGFSRNRMSSPNDSVTVVEGRPLYLINGKAVSAEELKNIKPDEIKSVMIKATSKVSGVLIRKKDN